MRTYDPDSIAPTNRSTLSIRAVALPIRRCRSRPRVARPWSSLTAARHQPRGRPSSTPRRRSPVREGPRGTERRSRPVARASSGGPGGSPAAGRPARGAAAAAGVRRRSSLGSLSTSSLGLLSVDGAGQGRRSGATSLPIRSDEWLTQAPIDLSVLAPGSSTAPPLSQDPDLIYQIVLGRLVESVLFHEGNLLRLGPVAARRDALLGVPGVAVAPAVLWRCRRCCAAWAPTAADVVAGRSCWSPWRRPRCGGRSCRCGSWPSPPPAATCCGSRRDRMVARHGRPTALLLAGRGRRAARPARDLLRPVVADPRRAARARDRRRPRRRAADAGAPALLDRRGRRRASPWPCCAGTLWENAAALSAELNTVYPGLRRVTGAAQTPAQLFGGPGLFEMEDVGAPDACSTRARSRSGFLVCALWAAVSGARAWAAGTTAQRGAIATLAAATALWSAVGDVRLGRPRRAPAAPQRRCCRCAPRRPSASRPRCCSSCWPRGSPGDPTRLAVGRSRRLRLATAYGVGDLRRVCPPAAPGRCGWRAGRGRRRRTP